MSEYLGSAFRSFVGNRQGSNGHSLPPSSSGDPRNNPLPFDRLPIPRPISSLRAGLNHSEPSPAFESGHRSHKRFRLSSVPTVHIPEHPAPLPLISPVSILPPSLPSLSSPSGAGPALPVVPDKLSAVRPQSQKDSLIPCLTEVNTYARQLCATSVPMPLPTIAHNPAQTEKLEAHEQSPPTKTTQISKKEAHRNPQANVILPTVKGPLAPSSSPSPDEAVFPQQHDVYSCSHCDSKFSTRDLMAEHVKIEHKRPFMCSLSSCSASFSKQNHLTRHIRVVHNKERPFACTEPGCGSRFGSKSHLGDHTRAVHMRLRNFKCPMCDASWSKRFNLNKHIRIRHLGEKPFKCGICNASFGTRSHVLRHQQKVHLQGNSSEVQKG